MNIVLDSDRCCHSERSEESPHLVLQLPVLAVILSEARSAQSKEPCISPLFVLAVILSGARSAQSKDPCISPLFVLAVILSGARSAQSKEPEAARTTPTARTFLPQSSRSNPRRAVSSLIMLNALAMLAVFLADAQQHITADKPLAVKLVKDGIDWATFSNYLLVFVGLVTCIVIFIQTIQTKKAAKAALLNAQAVINAERAWIVVSVESPAPNQFNFIATNVGRTPANVKSIWSTSIIAKRGEVLQVPLDEKTAESLMNTPSCLIPPTASQIVFRCNTEDMEKQGAFGRNMTFAQGFSNLWFYGRIVYSDILQPDASPLHETKWLYWHIPVEGAIPFPDPHRPEHNSYT